MYEANKYNYYDYFWCFATPVVSAADDGPCTNTTDIFCVQIYDFIIMIKEYYIVDNVIFGHINV